MEIITARKNRIVRRLRELAADGAYRCEQGVFVCDGEKTLREALSAKCEVQEILWRDAAGTAPENIPQYIAQGDVFEYASPLKNSPGPVFTVKMPEIAEKPVGCAIVLEGVQDPGNVGTVIRTAFALGIDAVVLTGACAELYHPKTVRATMGAIFSQYVLETEDLAGFLEKNKLPLYGAALSESTVDIRTVELKGCAVAIGNEGRGLTEKLQKACRTLIKIPMSPGAESLNAGIAAGIVMWEMVR